MAAHCRKQEAATRSGAASPGSITGTRRSLDQIAARPTSSACEMVAAGSAFHARTFAPCWGIFKDPAAATFAGVLLRFAPMTAMLSPSSRGMNSGGRA